MCPAKEIMKKESLEHSPTFSANYTCKFPKAIHLPSPVLYTFQSRDACSSCIISSYYQ